MPTDIRRTRPATVKATSGGVQDEDRVPTCDPSIDPSCDPALKLDPSLLTAALVLVPRPSSGATARSPLATAEPANGGPIEHKTSTTTMLLAVGAVIAAGGVAWWMFKGKRRRR